MAKQAISRMCATMCLLTAGSAFAECDLAYGREIFEPCAACHTHVSDEFDKSGPNLSGLFGRPAGTTEYRFGFSKAMTESGIVWDEKTLEKFLQRPAALVRGTTMLFAGITDAEDRAELICFLKEVTKTDDQSDPEEPKTSQ